MNNRRNRLSLTWGLILITFGAIFLVNSFLPVVWPLAIIALGVSFFISALLNRVGGLAIPGGILLVLGIMLFYQAMTGQWATWIYLWPMVTTGLGLGMVTGNLLGMGGAKTRRVSWLWLITGLAFTLLSWLWYTSSVSYSWAWIILGTGLQFLIVSLLSRVSGLAIPGTIIAVIGGLLYWQNATDNWESWSFTWPLVLLGVGLSFVLAYLFGLRSKALFIVGLYFVFISTVFFFIFGAFFARDWALMTYWPVIFILLGGGLLLQGSSRQKRLKNKVAANEA